jgi:hypothetical protein
MMNTPDKFEVINDEEEREGKADAQQHDDEASKCEESQEKD